MKKPIRETVLVTAAIAGILAGFSSMMYQRGNQFQFIENEEEDSLPTQKSTVVPGEMLSMAVVADQVTWKCVPPTEDFAIYGESNRWASFSFREVGERYTIIAAGISEEGKTLLWVMEVEVVPPSGQEDEPEDPTVPPAALDEALVTQVRAWCESAQVSKTVAASLADNFSKVAEEIRAGKLSTAEEIARRTYELNSKLDLKGAQATLGKIAAYITNLSDSGSLTTPAQHARIWESIAKGLRDYAS